MDIFKILEQQERLKRELFNIVYQWGRWNVKADYSAPAFQNKLNELLRSKYGK